MTVRAKFRVHSVTKTGTYHGPAAVSDASIKLTAVTGSSEENKRFFKATPNGEINMLVMRPEVAEQFVPGQEVYVDFTPVPFVTEPASLVGIVNKPLGEQQDAAGCAPQGYGTERDPLRGPK